MRKRWRVLVCAMASAPFSTSCQAAGRFPQFRQGKIGRDAQVTAKESSLFATIGAPVPPTPPITSPRFVRRKGSLLAGKGESRGRFQPSIPGRGIKEHLHVLLLL